MCGIVAYLGNREARQILVDCLGRLEHRAYDSAGIALLAGGKLKTLRSIGSNANLRTALKRTPLMGKIGIGHACESRSPSSSNNVPPHSDCSNSIAVVCDGGIANYHELKAELERKGHVFSSASDSELVAHLVERDSGDLTAALREILPRLQGEFSLVVLSQQEPDKLIAARKGDKALMVGHHYDGYFVASDIKAITHTQSFQTLENGELAVVTYGGVELSKFDGTPVERPLLTLSPAQRADHFAPSVFKDSRSLATSVTAD